MTLCRGSAAEQLAVHTPRSHLLICLAILWLNRALKLLRASACEDNMAAHTLHRTPRALELTGRRGWGAIDVWLMWSSGTLLAHKWYNTPAIQSWNNHWRCWLMCSFYLSFFPPKSCEMEPKAVCGETKTMSWKVLKPSLELSQMSHSFGFVSIRATHPHFIHFTEYKGLISKKRH